MGAVFSIRDSSRFLEDLILRLGDAAFATFRAYTTDYILSVCTVYPYCEPAEIEPFEDFTEAVEELLTEESISVSLPEAEEKSRKFGIARRQPLHPHPHAKVASSSRDVWIRQIEKCKDNFLHVIKDATRKAKQFRRRFDSFGPPDWIDPGESLLPPKSPYGLYPPNVIRSQFPYAAPHIIVTSPPPDEYPHLAVWVNKLDCQDHAWGHRLIVAWPPSCSGPNPFIINFSATCYPFRDDGKSDPAPPEGLPPEDSNPVPALIPESDDGSSTSSEFSDIDEYSVLDVDPFADPIDPIDPIDTDSSSLSSASYPEKALGEPVHSPFWLPEDDEELPPIPEDW